MRRASNGPPTHTPKFERNVCVSDAVTTFLPLVAIVGLFWLLVIRPTQRRNKALDQMRRAIEPGDRVMLTSGIYGTVREVEGARAHLEVAEGVVIEVASAAIGSKDEGQVDAAASDEGATDADVRPEEER